jgi:Flp pilus assembly protein TadG
MNPITSAKSALATLKGRLSPLVSCFAHNERGVAAVEFALIAVPFFAILFAIMETALVFFASQALETVAADSGRLILTGQAQNSGFDQAQFKNQVCARVVGLFDCASKLYVDVRKFSSFASISLPNPLDQNGQLPQNQTDYSYQPGGPGDIVVVRLFYNWPVYVSLLDKTLAGKGQGHLIVATSAFRNEPY